MKIDKYLSIDNISFSYKSTPSPLIYRFSCEIPRSSRVVILGLNGSGKTTLINLLLGVLQPDNGKINLINSAGIQNLSNLNGAVGFLSQMEIIPFDYLVNEYILLGRLPYIPMFSLPSGEDQQVVREVLETLKMPDFYNKRLREISGGELQRVRLARILAQKPEIILMDEPATHLDIKNKRSLYQLINELAEQGKTIIYSSHDPLEIAENSDFCILMSKIFPTRMISTFKLLKTALLSEYFETELKVR